MQEEQEISVHLHRWRRCGHGQRVWNLPDHGEVDEKHLKAPDPPPPHTSMCTVHQSTIITHISSKID